ncbi:MAG: hypothetical protein ABEH35_02400 [Haloarculaceae archaeon]
MATNSVERQQNATDLPDDVVADLLAEPRRRLLIAVLAEHDGSVTLEAAAGIVAARERGVAPEAVDETARRTVRDELFREHLPKLTATATVEYDSMCGTVELRRPELAEQLDSQSA